MLTRTLYQALVVCVVCLCLASQRLQHRDLLRALKLIKSKSRSRSKSSRPFSRLQKKSQDGRHQLDLRGHRIFYSSSQQDCCPTVTQLSKPAVAINSQGILLELYNASNFTQAFYERRCHHDFKDKSCQFVSPSYRAKCRQQFSYVYAFGRTFGNTNEEYKIDYIRVKTGCNCVAGEPSQEVLRLTD